MKTVYKLSCVVALALGMSSAQACENNQIQHEAEQMIAATAQQTKAEIRSAIRYDLSQEWLLAPVEANDVLTAKAPANDKTGDDDA